MREQVALGGALGGQRRGESQGRLADAQFARLLAGRLACCRGAGRGPDLPGRVDAVEDESWAAAESFFSLERPFLGDAACFPVGDGLGRRAQALAEGQHLAARSISLRDSAAKRAQETGERWVHGCKLSQWQTWRLETSC